jgi:molecular chaperone GrpE (heat shock protein)
MFYGIIQENYVYEDCLLEINLKDAISTIKKTIKNAILKLIDKIEGLLNKGKDNKIKQGLRSLLNKLKSLLTKSEKIETKEEAQELTQEVNDAKDELDDIVDRGYVDELTIGEIKAWFKENKTSDNQAGLILYKPNKNVGKVPGKIFKFIKKDILPMIEVDEHVIHLVVIDKDSDNIIARRELLFSEISEKTQQYILNDPYIKKYGYLIYD